MNEPIRLYVKQWVPNSDYPKEGISFTMSPGEYGPFPPEPNGTLLSFLSIAIIPQAIVSMDDGSIKCLNLDLISTLSERSGRINFGPVR